MCYFLRYYYDWFCCFCIFLLMLLYLVIIRFLFTYLLILHMRVTARGCCFFLHYNFHVFFLLFFVFVTEFESWLCFRSCLFVCLFSCLSVYTTSHKVDSGFQWAFRIMYIPGRENNWRDVLVGSCSRAGENSRLLFLSFIIFFFGGSLVALRCFSVLRIFSTGRLVLVSSVFCNFSSEVRWVARLIFLSFSFEMQWAACLIIFFLFLRGWFKQRLLLGHCWPGKVCINAEGQWLTLLVASCWWRGRATKCVAGNWLLMLRSIYYSFQTVCIK